MELHHLKMYFKAGVLVPFYLACSVSILFGFVAYMADQPDNLVQETEIYHILKGTLTSGFIGLCSFTLFLNLKPSIANHSVYRTIAWFLLPACFMIFLLLFEINWKVMTTKKPEDDFITVYYLSIMLFHSIGLSISFVDFRNTMILRKNQLMRSQK
jgi:hypothetical protein